MVINSKKCSQATNRQQASVIKKGGALRESSTLYIFINNGIESVPLMLFQLKRSLALDVCR